MNSAGMAPRNGPMYGIRLNNPMISPTSAQYGIPISQNPSMQNAPTSEATSSCHRK